MTSERIKEIMEHQSEFYKQLGGIPPVLKHTRNLHNFPRGTRAFLERRDGKKCLLCHCRTKTVIHHSYELAKDKNPYLDPNNPKYLCLLCLSCHQKIHSNNRDSPLFQAYLAECEVIAVK